MVDLGYSRLVKSRRRSRYGDRVVLVKSENRVWVCECVRGLSVGLSHWIYQIKAE